MEKAIKIISKFKTIFLIIISIFVTFSVNMNMDYTIPVSESFSGNSLFLVIIFILIYWLLKKFLEVKNKRMIVCCAILAILFAGFETVGKSLDAYLNLDGILYNSTALKKSIIYWLGYAILIFAILGNIFSILDKKKILDKTYKWFTNNKRSFLLTWGIIFVAWIPYFINYYPGVTTPDSAWQIYQGLGLNVFTNHQPIFHTLLIGIPMNIGKLLGNYNTGVAIYSLCQMIITSGIFSFAIYYMAKRNVDIRVRALALIFYVFYPVNGMYSITMWKDIPFAVAMLIFTIMLTEIAINREHFMKSKLKTVLLIISMILVILLRNNGIYVILGVIPFMFIFAFKNYKKLIVVSFIVIAFYILWKGPIFSILNVEDGLPREALSIPLQQFARMSKNESLTDEEKAEIYKYLPVDNLADLYKPKISDNVKKNFNDKLFEEDKIGFLKLWGELCFKYPRTAVESFLCNSYGYWYPEFGNWVAARTAYVKEQEGEADLELKITPIANLELAKKYDSLIDRRDIPLSSMLYSIGFAFWVVMIMLMYAIYKKEYRKMLIYIPIIVLWATCLASPVSGEFRYIYSMFTALPIFIGIHFMKDNKSVNKEIGDKVDSKTDNKVEEK